MKKQFNEKDIIVALRSKSKNSVPSDEFLTSLEKKITQKKYLRFRIDNIFKSPHLLFTLSILVVAVLASTSMIKKPNDSVSNALKTDNINSEENIDSPLLTSLDLETDENKYLHGNGYLERRSEKSMNPNAKALKDEIKESLSVSDTPSIPAETHLDLSEPQPISNQNSAIRVDKLANLKGGVIDDNMNYEKFRSYSTIKNFTSENSIDFTDRYEISFLIEKIEETKVPIAAVGQDILIEDYWGVKYKLKSDSDGRIYFYPQAYTERLRRYKERPVPYSIIAEPYKVTVNGNSQIFQFEDRHFPITLSDEDVEKRNLTLDLLFTIDSTESMYDQIQKLRDTMTDISEEISNMKTKPKIRYGLVVYRDKDEEYITRIYDFTDDFGRFKKQLKQIEASGGGDEPDDVNSALEDSLEKMSWSQEKNAVRLMFLITDAPPHMDYEQKYDYRVATLRAMELGVKIYPIASSDLVDSEGEYIYRQLALVTNAKYIFITNENGDSGFEDEEFTVNNLDKIVVDVVKSELDPKYAR